MNSELLQGNAIANAAHDRVACGRCAFLGRRSEVDAHCQSCVIGAAEGTQARTEVAGLQVDRGRAMAKGAPNTIAHKIPCLRGSCTIMQEELETKATDTRNLAATVRQLADRMDRLEASSPNGTLSVHSLVGRHRETPTELHGPLSPERCRISRIIAVPVGPGARNHPGMVGHLGRPECQGRRAQHPRGRSGWCAGACHTGTGLPGVH